MRTTRCFLLAAALAAAALPASAQRRERAHVYRDPLAAVASSLDDEARAVLEAYPSYDAGRILDAVRALEARHGTSDEGADDAWILAQGYLELAVVQRFYERHLPDTTPEAIAGADPDEWIERGLELAEEYAARHPEHADVERVRGELVSFQISGMIGGMTKGPEARKAIDRAVQLDPQNAWAAFARARMHYHNPAFVGGDVDLALREFRSLFESVEDVRVALYVAHCYRKKEMPSQAHFWARRALALAPENPEARWLEAEIAAEGAEGGPQ